MNNITGFSFHILGHEKFRNTIYLCISDGEAPMVNKPEQVSQVSFRVSRERERESLATSVDE